MSDDEIFWTYGDKCKKGKRDRGQTNKQNVENLELSDKKSMTMKSDSDQRLYQELENQIPQQDNFGKVNKSNHIGGVEFQQAQKTDNKFQNQNAIRFSQQINIEGLQKKNTLGISNQNNSRTQGMMKQHDENHYPKQDIQNFNFSFSPQKGLKSDGMGLSQTVTSNYVFDPSSPQANTTLNNRKRFNTSSKKVSEFSPSIYDKLNHSEYKYHRKGESIWEDLYNCGQFQMRKIEQLHLEKLNEKDKECIFKPKLNPNKYLMYENSSFLQRNEQWKEQRDNKLISQRQDKIQIDLKECTFQPALSSYRIRTEIPREQQLDFVQDNQISLLLLIKFYFFICYKKVFYLKTRLGTAQDHQKALFQNFSDKKDIHSLKAKAYDYLSENQQGNNSYRAHREAYLNYNNQFNQNDQEQDVLRPSIHSKRAHTSYRDKSLNQVHEKNLQNIKQTGGIVKSYYIRERERFEKCKQMLSKVLKKDTQ
ncbi:hypothetical protein ABPG72_000099 [Tetrahymena utriculariae]